MTCDDFLASVHRERTEAANRRQQWQDTNCRAGWWQEQLIYLNSVANWGDVKPEDRPAEYREWSDQS